LGVVLPREPVGYESLVRVGGMISVRLKDDKHSAESTRRPLYPPWILQVARLPAEHPAAYATRDWPEMQLEQSRLQHVDHPDLCTSVSEQARRAGGV